MIKRYKLPTVAQPLYNFTQEFNKGIKVTFTIRWNGKANIYFMDIKENNADPLIDDIYVTSIPLTVGLNVINQYNFSMESIECVRVDADPNIETTNFNELGDTFHIIVTTDYEDDE